LLKQDCGACHGLTLKGGLGPSLMPESLSSKTDAELTTTILEGRSGTAMPPWRQFISESEARWLIRHLRNQ
jgi:cytochrome c55X